MYPVRRQISPHASRLRREMTDAESKVWAVLRNRQIENCKFRRQATIGPFVVDFLCIDAGLVVELDGGQHCASLDGRRTAFLQGRGFNLVRFWNHDVLENLEGVVEVIRLELRKKRRPSPNPLP